MELIFEILIVWPFFGLCQGMAGALWPSENLAIRRLQRITGLILITGIVFAIVAIVASWTDTQSILMPAGVAWLCFVATGLLGKQIEQSCKDADPQVHSDEIDQES